LCQSCQGLNHLWFGYFLFFHISIILELLNFKPSYLSHFRHNG
jgi:hypothetical protein